jgi:glutamate--cysteine ligase catalytic subunit
MHYYFHLIILFSPSHTFLKFSLILDLFPFILPSLVKKFSLLFLSSYPTIPVLSPICCQYPLSKMGFLELGEPPLSWPDCVALSDYIREHGAIQFLNLYNLHKSDRNDSLFWGEEMEYHIVYQPSSAPGPRVYVKAAETAINVLSKAEEMINGSLSWHLEYGAWMIECVPKDPYNDYLEELLTVEAKLVLSRRKMQTVLSAIDPDVFPISLPCFPLMGVGDYYFPKEDATRTNNVSSSIYLDDHIICPHPRFPTLTRNIISRRGRPQEMFAPVFVDEFTNEISEPVPGQIHMDASGFGMGMCCVQTTVNAKSIEEARYLHDQFVPLGPIMLALSACTPYFKGKLSDYDCRWKVLSQSMDDRTDAEREAGILPRYSPSALYLSTCPTNRPEYNDLQVHIHHPTFDFLSSNGVDESLARHIAYNFSRDPLVIFPDKVTVDDSQNTNHFENFQSTNWNSVRFKPPPTMNSTVGWRVEFRTMDIQLTDFENAAYAIFIVLLARMIISLNLNFQIAMSKVHENFERSYGRDAILNQKFWFKYNIVTANCKNVVFSMLKTGNCKDRLDELTIKEIFCGNDEFLGLLGFIDKYLLEVVGCCMERYQQINRYLNLIRRRASGEIPTGARFIRDLVRGHEDYRKDSIITPKIASDIVRLGKGEEWNERLLGSNS